MSSEKEWKYALRNKTIAITLARQVWPGTSGLGTLVAVARHLESRKCLIGNDIKEWVAAGAQKEACKFTEKHLQSHRLVKRAHEGTSDSPVAKRNPPMVQTPTTEAKSDEDKEQGGSPTSETVIPEAEKGEKEAKKQISTDSVDDLRRRIEQLEARDGTNGVSEEVLDILTEVVPQHITSLDLMSKDVKNRVLRNVPGEIKDMLPEVVRSDLSGLDTWLSKPERATITGAIIAQQKLK